MIEPEKLKLKELNCSFLSGFAFKSIDYISNGIPLVKIGNIQNGIIRITNSVNHVAIDLINSKTEKFLLKDRDVLIAMTGQGSVGRIGRLYLENCEKAFLNQRVGKFICDEVNLNIDYLYYILITPEYQKILFDSASGSGQPNLSPEIILNVKIPYVNYTTQTAIAEILSSLDDKIELNNQINQNLEALAQALFKQWFVDFEFPNENGEPYKSSGGEMVDSELGEIPMGWECGKLADFTKTTSGGTPSRKKPDYYENGSILWVKSKELNNSMFFDTEEKINELGLKNSSAKLLPPYSVLIAMYGATVGQFGLITNEASCNQAICAVLPSENLPYSYNYLFFQNYRSQFENFASGSAQQNISQELIKSILITVPSREKMLNFQYSVDPILQNIESNCKENQYLKSLRDTLLPRLISGELEIKEAMEQIS